MLTQRKDILNFLIFTRFRLRRINSISGMIAAKKSEMA